MMTISKKMKIVKEWHDAINNKNKDGISDLIKENVKIGGPKGEVEGRNEMLEWIDRAQISLIPKRYFVKNNIVIAEEFGEWHSPETGEVIGSQVVASVFIIENNLITSVYRYEDIIRAFEATGLSEKDEAKIN